MARKSPNPMEKVTLNLFKGDYAKLGATYPLAGAALIIRRLVRKHIESLERTNVNTGTHVQTSDLLDLGGPGDDSG